MILAATFRKAAQCLADGDLSGWICALDGDAFDLWESFSEWQPCSPEEMVLGLLLLAEILESAE